MTMAVIEAIAMIASVIVLPFGVATWLYVARPCLTKEG